MDLNPANLKSQKQELVEEEEIEEISEKQEVMEVALKPIEIQP